MTFMSSRPSVADMIPSFDIAAARTAFPALALTDAGAPRHYFDAPAGTQVAGRVIDAMPQEFPRCDERLTGKPYRYAYTVTMADGSSGAPSGVIRHDLETGARTIHDFGPDNVPGEFVFVPRSADAGEDDGWLMGYVVDARADATDLVLLDARDIAAPPVAVIALPRRVPLGFHGNWIASA